MRSQADFADFKPRNIRVVKRPIAVRFAFWLTGINWQTVRAIFSIGAFVGIAILAGYKYGQLGHAAIFILGCCTGAFWMGVVAGGTRNDRA